MKSKNCLVIFNNSWGEVDFILPILKNLYEKKNNIYSSFKSIEMLNEKKNYQDLYNILNKLSLIIQIKNKNQKITILKLFLNLLMNPKYIFLKLNNFNFFKIKSYFKRIKLSETSIANIKFFKNNNIKIDTILCADWDTNYFDWIREFPNAKFILFPHGIVLRGTFLNKFRNVSKKMFQESFKIRNYQLSRFPKKTILFSVDKDELDYFKKFTPKNIKLKVLGFPRLTRKWTEYLHSEKKISSIRIEKKNIFLIIGKKTYLGKKEIINKIKSVIKIAEKYGYNLIIKNHPRNQFNLSKFTNLSKKISITETNLSISGTLKFCEIVILTSKSGVSLECAFQKKLVVEYYKYGRENKKNKVYEFNINDKIQSLYKYLGLVYTCENHEDLSIFFQRLMKDAKFYNKILTKQNKAVLKILFKNKLKKSIVNYI